MNLKIKLTLQKIHSTTNILIFEKHVKDLIKKFKKMQLQIHGLDLSLKNTTYNSKKTNLSKIFQLQIIGEGIYILKVRN